MNYLLLLIAMLLMGCAHKSKAPPPSQLIFPHGTYQHKVKIEILHPARTLQLNGVVSFAPEHLKVIGLSHFATTVFRIHDNLLTGELHKEIFNSTLQQHEERFMEYYSLLKEVFLRKKGESEFVVGPARFTLLLPDEHQIYRKIVIQHPHVQLSIEVSKYEF